MKTQLTLICLLAFSLRCFAHHDGGDVCDDMYIGHHGPLTLNNPYEFKIEKSTQKDNWLVQLVVSEGYIAANNQFYSFVIEARDATNENQIGNFTWDEEYRLQYVYYDCSNEYPHSTVTNLASTYRESVNLTFGLAGFEGLVYFKAAAVQSSHTWWNNIKSDIYDTVNVTATSSTTTTATTTTTTTTTTATHFFISTNSSSSIQGTFFLVVAFFFTKYLLV